MVAAAEGPAFPRAAAVAWVKLIQAANCRPDRNDLGRRGLQGQQGRPDRADAGDLRQTPAALVGAMPGQELGLDHRKLGLTWPEPARTRRLQGKHLSCERGQGLVSRDAREQRGHVCEARGPRDPNSAA